MWNFKLKLFINLRVGVEVFKGATILWSYDEELLEVSFDLGVEGSSGSWAWWVDFSTANERGVVGFVMWFTWVVLCEGDDGNGGVDFPAEDFLDRAPQRTVIMEMVIATQMARK